MNIKNKFLVKTTHYFALIILFLGLSFQSFSQDLKNDSIVKSKKWDFLIDVYMLFPNMDGETGIGNSITVPIDANTGDIFSTLKLGGMLYFEAHNRKWSVNTDFVFMNLEKDITPGILIESGTAGMNQYIWEVAGLYRIVKFLEVGVGGRLNYLSAEIDAMRNVLPIGSEELTAYKSKTFYDPIIITRLSTDIKGKWLFQFRGDLGGFGVGSDFTWQLQGYLGYRFKKVFQLTAGYRILGIDYDKGEDLERFLFNVNEFGPVVRLGFYF